ncbi:MAG: hypothetical protein LZF60_180002 [Nitrospira sp.]|nr:MAG: hypothetical protein LZF60_180002 [Nitrospira sp.]
MRSQVIVVIDFCIVILGYIPACLPVGLQPSAIQTDEESGELLRLVRPEWVGSIS